MRDKQIKKWFLLVMLAFIISAASILLVPFSINAEGDLNILGYTAGVIFWAGFLAGTSGYIVLNKKIDIKPEIKFANKNLPDVMRFFSNPPAKVMDVFFIMGLIGTVYCASNAAANQVAAILFLVFMVAGLYAHILFNGKIYQYIWKNAETHTITGLDEKKERNESQ